MGMLAWKAGLNWLAGNGQGNYADPNSYVEAAVPGPGDTVSVSAGDSSLPFDLYGLYVEPLPQGESNINFSSRSPNAPSVIATLTPQPTIEAERAYPGATVNGVILDLAGGGGVVGASLLLTEFTASSTVNVSGTALMDLAYDNTLGGTVNIGTGGGPAAPATSNSHGATGELDVDVHGWGSTDVDGSGNPILRGYRPEATNSGTMNVGQGAQLRIGFDVSASGGIYINGRFRNVFSGDATFANTGTINVQAGGGLSVLDNADALDYSPNPVFNGFFSEFLNEGRVNILGSSGKQTAAEFQGFLTGGGLIAVDGGTATDSSQTVLSLDAVVYGTNILVRNGTVRFADNDLNFNRAVGGAVTFGDGAGVLEISADGQASAPYNSAAPNPLLPGLSFAAASMQLPFGATVQNFQAGDHIRLDGMSDLESFGQNYYLNWDAGAHTLAVMLSPQVLSGIPPGSPTEVAQLTIAGNYSASDFSIQLEPTAAAGNSPFLGTVDITTDAAGVAIGGGGAAIVPGTIGVYRFFDSKYGTHFFTADASEANTLASAQSPGYRPDLVRETNGFGAIDPSVPDPGEVKVYRFFDSVYGTHFFTASDGEKDALSNPASPNYRADLVFESGSSFYEDGTRRAGDVPVYRLFDSAHGTHFYTGDQNEFAAITTAGSTSYRPDLVSEGIGFYAPAATFT